MKIMKASLLPAGLGEDVNWSQAGRGVGDVVEQIDSILDCHGPQGSISQLRPVDGGMEHHSSSHSHDGPDIPLCHSIVMMSTNTCKADDLFKLGQFLSKGCRGEGATIVSKEGLGDNTMVAAEGLELVFGTEGLMAVQVSLEDSVHKARGMVNKEAATRVHALRRGLATGGEEPALGTGNKVVHRDLLSWEKMLSLEDTLTISNSSCLGSRRRSESLLSILAGGTARHGSQLANSRVKAASGLCEIGRAHV